jgi:hypothetical protein
MIRDRTFRFYVETGKAIDMPLGTDPRKTGGFEERKSERWVGFSGAGGQKTGEND